MRNQNNPIKESAHVTPKDLEQWQRQELLDLAKAVELRTKEVNDLAKAFRTGKITITEAEDRIWKYSERWGEALPGVHATKGASEEDILARIDETRNPHFVERLLKKNTKRSKARDK
jgi:hypothetical protein